MVAFPILPIPRADAVLLVECLYYLAQAERQTFVDGLACTHPAATVTVSTPTSGGDYFTDPGLRHLFARYRFAGVNELGGDHAIYAFQPRRLRFRRS